MTEFIVRSVFGAGLTMSVGLSSRIDIGSHWGRSGPNQVAITNLPQ